jgi:hypothetical protein
MSSWREVVKESLAFCSRHTRGLLAASGLMLLPLVAVEIASALFRGSPLIPHALRSGWTNAASLVVGTLAGMVVLILTDGVVTFYVAQQLADRPLGYQRSWARGLSRARPVVTASLASLVPATGFVLLCLVPMCLVGMVIGTYGRGSANPFLGWVAISVAQVVIVVRMAFLTQAAVIERQGGFEAYRRSLQLLGGRWRTVAAVVVPIQLARCLLGRLIIAIVPPPWADAVDHLLVWLTLPLMATATTILYLSIRGQTEGYDRARLAADLES